MNRAIATALVLAAGSTAVLADIPRPAKARTVATDGQSAPGLTNLFIDLYNAASPTEFSTPSASRSGVTCFFTAISGTGVTGSNNEAAYLGLPAGTLQLVAREGAQALNLPAGVTYGTMGTGYLFANSPTSVVLAAALAGSGVTSANNAVIYFGDPATWSPLAVKGNNAADLAPLLYSGFDNAQFTLAPDGTLSIPGTVSGFGVTAANDKAIWTSESGSAPRLIAREGDPAPGIAGATIVNFLDTQDSLISPVAMQGGQVGFFAQITGGGSTTSNDSVIYKGGPGTVTIVIREGDPAPTLPAPIICSTIGLQSFAANGTACWVSSLTGTGTSGTNNLAVFRGTPGTFALVARKGSPAPGYPAHNFNTVTNANRPRVLGDGTVLLQGSLTGGGATTNDDQFLAVSYPDGTSDPVAREGTQYPDLPAGVVLNGTFGLCSINNDATVTFTAVLRGTGVVATNNDTLWSWNQARGLRLLAREGESMLVSTSEARTTASTDGFDIFGNSATDDGFRSSLDNTGSLHHRGVYTDGSSRIVVLDTGLYACGLADIGSAGGTPGFDGVLDNNDFIVFIDYFFAQNPIADRGTTGGTAGSDALFNNNDFIVFIDQFFAACP